MIRDVYRQYFQKSHTFLYPLLRIPKNYGNVNKRPKKTYIAAKNVLKPEDMRLIVIYENSNDPSWKVYFEKIVLKNQFLESYFINSETDDIVVIFDISSLEEDVKKFLKGKYSQLSQDARKSISSFYGVHTPEWAYLESFLYPDKYFKEYSKILEIDEQVLRDVGELCDKYDLEKETFPYEIPEELIFKNYDTENNVGL